MFVELQEDAKFGFLHFKDNFEYSYSIVQIHPIIFHLFVEFMFFSLLCDSI